MLKRHVWGRLILNSFTKHNWVVLTWSLAFWCSQIAAGIGVIWRLEGAGPPTWFIHMLIVGWELSWGWIYTWPLHVAWAFSQYGHLSLTSYKIVQGSKRTRQKLSVKLKVRPGPIVSSAPSYPSSLSLKPTQIQKERN